MFRLPGIHLSCKILEVLEWWREGAEGGGVGGFYVTPPAPNRLHRQSPSSGDSSALLFVIGGMVVLIILLILILLFWKFNKAEKLRKSLKRNGSLTATKDFWSGSLQTISYFDFQTLKKATKDFHPDNLLGRGGFGPVYRAWKLYERSSVIDLVDPKLREHGFMEKDVLQVIHVAFLCLQTLANLRPPMSKIVALLTCKVEMVGTPLRPAFLERRGKKVENLSWDTISEVFSSPLHSESSSLPRQQN
ncbi:hypothetical protein SADUNF_Sadunf18G0104500 [Salix dunnii]|uniref:Uncharacterized protein n=1 Tax=Salix dunnii TaxID=1413687 RepID=A0A835J8V2_9ROSI|nr:hypothetical protein SADUNF_Sadunf18G0104500 [Salix dunnii]